MKAQREGDHLQARKTGLTGNQSCWQRYSWAFRLQHYEKINGSYLSHPVCGILLQHSEWTKTRADLWPQVINLGGPVNEIYRSSTQAKFDFYNQKDSSVWPTEVPGLLVTTLA